MVLDLLRPLPALPVEAPTPVDGRAHAVGYATAGAFHTAFRRTLGTTPSRCLRERGIR
ncbi:hypothetical protein [Kitasatospora sp. NPDC092286]|uniref:hypothetical protein n=1 Tax=Kitasatospora sp. NPDC092286 TaxID=3364087 RepID=UPI0037F73D81